MTLAALPHYANVGFAVIVPTVTADSITQARLSQRLSPAREATATSGRLFANAALKARRGVTAIAVALRRRLRLRGRARLRAAGEDRPSSRRGAALSHQKTDPAQAARTVLDRSPATCSSPARPPSSARSPRRCALAGYTGEFGASDGFYNSDTIATYAKTLDGALRRLADAAARAHSRASSRW